MSLAKKLVRGTAKLGLFLSLSVILGSTICYSQEAPTTGKVEGMVTGKEGENIAAAKIIITNRANKQSVATTTNSAGGYESAQLPRGDHSAREDDPGCDTGVVRGVG